MLPSDWSASSRILARILMVKKVNWQPHFEHLSEDKIHRFSLENSTQKCTQKAAKFRTKVFDDRLNG